MDSWTSGFYPATLYAMHDRAKLCLSSNAAVDVWRQLGQSWGTGEIPLATVNTVGHDVGFLSAPFMQEVRMCVNDILSGIKNS